MNHNYYGRYENIELRPLEKEDLEKLREWRNDSDNSKYLRQIGYITEEMQKKWFFNYLNDNDIVTFAICETKKLGRIVGSVSIYNFRGKIAEIGKIQIGDADAHGMGIGRISLVIAMKIGFELMKLDKFDGYVHPSNISAYKNDLSIGFNVVGEKESKSIAGGFENYIEIDYSRLKRFNKYIDSVEVSFYEQ